jgi:sodium-dependent phosphate cotransporter
MKRKYLRMRVRLRRMEKRSVMSAVLKLLLVFGFLYLFLVSIGLMGAAFKGFGKGFAETLISTTSNAFVGLFIGILATSLVQSSSTTTSIVVGMVASGVLGIGNAIPIMMGANIGTTVTNTMVSIGHITRREEFKRAVAGSTVHDFFNLICVSIMFPLELATGFLEKSATFLSGAFMDVGGIRFTSPVKAATKPVINAIKHFLTEDAGLTYSVGNILVLVTSVVFLFLSLYFIVKLMKSLLVEKIERALRDVLDRSGHVAILAGLVFTVVVQSSSITTSLLVPLLGAGVLTLESAFPITMGANIGTTTTAILAAFAAGNQAAITIAFVHFLFNTFGVVFIYPISIFRSIPISLARWLGDLAFRKRHYALAYVFSAFFLVPTLLIFVSRALR